MSAKEFVKSKMPKARAERQKTNGPFGKYYWLIRNGRESMYFAEGDTEAKAWKNAKERILEIDENDN